MQKLKKKKRILEGLTSVGNEQTGDGEKKRFENVNK